MLIRLLKQLICKHDYEHYRNIHGDEINMHFPIKRSEWVCRKCGNFQLREKLYKGDDSDDKSG